MNWTYSLIMLFAVVACGWLLRRGQASLAMTSRQKLGLGIGAFCGAMIGSKLPFVFSDIDGLLSGTAWLAHGKTIMCGIVGGYFGVELAKWVMDVRVKTGDTFAAPVAVAVAIGRVGCFNAGCCYGVATSLPWGVVYPTALDDPSLSRHPTQLYEAMFHITAAVALWALARRGLFRGQLIKLYILCYLGYRFLSEWIRPEVEIWLGLTGYQWAALLLAPLFIWLWARDRRQISAGEAPSLATASAP